MALNSKYINSRSILEEVFADTALQDDIPWADCMTWIGTSLDLIGVPMQYIKKVTGHKDNPNLDIENYKAKLPCDFYKLRQIAVNGLPCRAASNTFHHLLDGDCCGIDELGEADGDTFIDNFGNVFNTGLGIKYTNNDISFDLNNDYITLSVPEGKVCISYLAIPTDNLGFPLIPDDVSYKEAVKKYIIMKLDYISWRKQPDSRGLRRLYEDSQQEWSWYVGQAKNKAIMPDLDGMQSLANQMVRLKPRFNEHRGFFRFLNVTEKRKFK